MKFSIATLFLAATGLVSALPASENETNLEVRAEAGAGCSSAGRVNCSNSDGQRYPHILVCVDRGNGLKWFIQATCAAGTSCAYNDNPNQAWCKAY
ncbi:hypothetical protein V2G26_019204 [Clonostachys chloroleuca]|uniref:Uncharacterized protein n=1 Tax=Clonostachys chloroleuca TaxID=1926264 RepID=A0AA35M5W0_9HYPO|nr:unnamed protein product [Clonostachys chloroleuca]